MDQEHSKDMSGVYHDSMNKLFNGIKQFVPQYHQSITNIQQEYFQTFENLVGSTLDMHDEYVKKTCANTSAPELTLKTIHDLTEGFARFMSLQNQVTLATIDATQQNIRTFNDNAKSFADLNKNFIQSWISTFVT